jgi:transketolase
MINSIPQLNTALAEDELKFLKDFSTSCRCSIIKMVTNASSGHPGGSLSTLDYLALLYAFIISQGGEKIVISNGHISPAVYSVLAELGYISKEDVINNFRKKGSIYEGHVTRHVKGIWYGTGPLGIGVSIGAAFALAAKMQNKNEKVFAVMGDGEGQEGQVYESILFANKYKLDNLILFVDNNLLQLTGSLTDVMPVDLKAVFAAGNWEVFETNGHDFKEMWETLGKATVIKGKPVVIIGNTTMGKGVPYMESEAISNKSTWHGNPPNKDQADEAIKCLNVSPDYPDGLQEFAKLIKWRPSEPVFKENLSPTSIKPGDPILYDPSILTDCRTAYGKALLSLAKLNPEILAMSADLRGSVMTKFVAEELPNQHIECGIMEQNMVSAAGGLSFAGYTPFCSTFGAFMSSRAKDQARVNDINRTNVKMVSTHCGLSVGEDGPTHQAIDDSGSFLGMFNTMVIEPADPNHTDRIIRYAASHYGNFYVRMGRHKIPVILTEDGRPFYDTGYKYEYGKCDLIREGKDITIAATGATVTEALLAREKLAISNPNLSIEIVAVSSIKKFDQVLLNSAKKTQNLIVVEDHNSLSGLAATLSKHLLEQGINLKKFTALGVKEYQLSGKPAELYELAGISADAISKACL